MGEAVRAGTKRKGPATEKFYAVSAGHNPGIYKTWSECQEQVNGYRRAAFKSFSTEVEAQEFVEHGHDLKRVAVEKLGKFYGVKSGKVPGVYDNWAAASQQITGYGTPKVRAFTSRKEAEAFVHEDSGSKAPQSITAPAAKKQKRKPTGQDDIELPQARDIDYQAGDGPLPSDAEDGFDHRIHLDPATAKVQYKTDEHVNQVAWKATDQAGDRTVRIYTDGSALGNGKTGAVAGVGVYFGPRDTRNISEPLKGARQTNQRAELTAILRALEVAPRDRPVAIYTDSNYSIKCLTDWYKKWEQNGWLNSARKPVENKDLIERVLALINEREEIGKRYGDDLDTEPRDGDTAAQADQTTVVQGRARVKLIWVKGHKDDQGNIAADGLAVAGANEAKQYAI